MKLKTIKGQWLVTDGEREIDFKNDGLAAWYYVLTMKSIRRLPKLPRQIYPVRSLTPHPKKRRMTAKYKQKIKDIKNRYEREMHRE